MKGIINPLTTYFIDGGQFWYVVRILAQHMKYYYFIQGSLKVNNFQVILFLIRFFFRQIKQKSFISSQQQVFTLVYMYKIFLFKIASVNSERSHQKMSLDLYFQLDRMEGDLQGALNIILLVWLYIYIFSLFVVCISQCIILNFYSTRYRSKTVVLLSLVVHFRVRMLKINTTYCSGYVVIYYLQKKENLQYNIA
eukprot:TRINITY_DN2480_c0_g2_i4.p2 TRINITY_DN2480_c0_g2~~TRINITY_DN2480_c0_g2_i4.p2  ORF type:complete len:195 (+),score=-9.95 TRINITY_DN2480_c0_g2_i4:433-1017(+)